MTIDPKTFIYYRTKLITYLNKLRMLMCFSVHLRSFLSIFKHPLQEFKFVNAQKQTHQITIQRHLYKYSFITSSSLSQFIHQVDASFIRCFSAFHNILQRCADQGDQSWRRTDLAVHRCSLFCHNH